MSYTTAILLRRTDFGDNDLILTLFTKDRGKTSVIAKSAKRSQKRFAGALDLFTVSRILYKKGQGRLPLLQEAALKHVFLSFRSDICKTAYASYWAELIFLWIEEYENQSELYELFLYTLDTLDKGHIQDAQLNIFFQIKFLRLAGIFPVLENCVRCRRNTDVISDHKILFDLAGGGIVCEKCGRTSGPDLFISKATLKQLTWLDKNGFSQAGRIRFSQQSLYESQAFLETFILYHLGKNPRSLKFLHRIRENTDERRL